MRSESKRVRKGERIAHEEKKKERGRDIGIEGSQITSRKRRVSKEKGKEERKKREREEREEKRERTTMTMKMWGFLFAASAAERKTQQKYSKKSATHNKNTAK